ncbi:50S ribosomal protein L25/general stress protein Ctc [Sporocytophaga myxococcoides]|uniref:50S ribosomal protein L25/general stress protein Ctc n=1 Tax=Sporocytophaga myxococcoides TaxID=153721 RepID=UPI000425E9B8|nr:50S ribosomal protein L25/general stress protein Ctc [Sporocytophaga myxococcoides]
MNSLEIIGFKRANLGKRESKQLRLDANVPCVLYGGENQVHFYAPMFLFRDLVYTPNAYKVDLTVEGKKYSCILQDIQFHPVNDMILHADFLLLKEDKEVKMDVPVRITGTSPGVMKGGKLISKIKKVKLKALPKNLPDFIEADISSLEIGKSLRISDLKTGNYVFLNNKALPVVSVETTRALRGAAEEEKK